MNAGVLHPITFDETVRECTVELEAAIDDRETFNQVMARAIGLIDGYLRAGAISTAQHHQARAGLNRFIAQRIALEQLREAAVDAGLGDPDMTEHNTGTAQLNRAPCRRTATATDVLVQAGDAIDDRAALRDATVTGERSMARTVAAFNALYGTALTEVQGWQFMQILKLARAATGKPHLDDYVDGAAYAALAGEAAFTTRAWVAEDQHE